MRVPNAHSGISRFNCTDQEQRAALFAEERSLQNLVLNPKILLNVLPSAKDYLHRGCYNLGFSPYPSPYCLNRLLPRHPTLSVANASSRPQQGACYLLRLRRRCRRRHQRLQTQIRDRGCLLDFVAEGYPARSPRELLRLGYYQDMHV